MTDLDLVLLQGFKGSEFPKIEIYRSGEPLAGRISVLAVLSDRPVRVPDGVEVLPLDPEAVADFIEAAVVTMALALPLGLVAGRLGFRRAILIGMALQAVGLAVVCLVPEPPLLLASRVVAGIGVTLGGVVGAPFLAAAVGDRDRAHFFGLQAGASIP
jgi:hypothetical protein